MKLKDRRKAAGLTQKQVAEAVGVDQSQISNYEKGGYCPKMPTVLKLAELFNCTTKEITDGIPLWVWK